MPRANIAAVHAWRDEFRAQKQHQAISTERGIQAWATIVTILTFLYLVIGPAPYKHLIDIDPNTGAAAMSPTNRYFWMTLGGLSLPLLWLRRDKLIDALKTEGVLLALYAWFALTVMWALDRESSNRRLFMYVLELGISLSIALGFGSTRKFHHGLALACATIVGIDFVSWMVAPGVSMTSLGLAAIHSHKNQLGQVMMICGLVIGPYCLAPPVKSRRWLWIVTFLLCMAMLVASQSKTSLSILLVTMLATPVLLFVLKLSAQAVRAICSVIVMALFLFMLGWLGWCTAQGLDPFAPFQGITFSDRTDLWVFVFGEIVKHPLIGSGFGSFWDINPLLQPSLNNDLWFGSADVANQAHNGYLDLLVTTGAIGLGAALFLMFRWMARGLSMIRRALHSRDPDERAEVYALTVVGLFPMLVFVHNFMESSYFAPSAILGLMILMFGIDLDLAHARKKAASADGAKPANGRRQQNRHHR